jgi:hypothetical protein
LNRTSLSIVALVILSSCAAPDLPPPEEVVTQSLVTSTLRWFDANTVAGNVPGKGWGRMAPWTQRGGNLVAYAEFPPGSAPIVRVARSTVAAPTYSVVGWIPSPPGEIQEQPHLLELPDGTLLMAMRNRRADLTWYGLPVVRSVDGGATWQFLSQLDVNPDGRQRFDRGLWEPFLIRLPDGCIAGHYASEKHADQNPSFAQTLSFRVSCDGGAHWGPEQYTVAEAGAHRPGMAGVSRMADGRFILVFELCGTDDCRVRYKISPDGRSWPGGLGTPIPGQRAGPSVGVLSNGLVVVVSGCSGAVALSGDNGATWRNNPEPAWPVTCGANAAGATWPAVYQTGPSEVAVIADVQGAIRMRFGAVQ